MTQEAVTDKTEQTPEQVAVESSAAFEAGFGEVRGDTPAPVKAEEPKETKPEPGSGLPEAPKAEEPPKQADPLESVKAQLESITKKLGAIDQIDHRVKSYEGRLGKITSTLESLAAAKAAAETAAKNDAPDKKALSEKYAKKRESVLQDLPDIAELVDAVREEFVADRPQNVDAAALKADIDKALAERLDQIQANTAAEVAKARQVAAVDLKHEGWEDTIKTPEFEQWFGRQAPETQALANSPKAADAIRMLDAFKADAERAKKEQEKKQANADRLARAAAPKGVTAPTPASITDEEAFASGYKAIAGG